MLARSHLQAVWRTLTVVYATPIRKGECRLFARFPSSSHLIYRNISEADSALVSSYWSKSRP